MVKVHVMTTEGMKLIPGIESTQVREVWHYTDSYGLHGIVTANELWASTPLTLNDTTEMRHGIDKFRQAWADLEGAPFGSEWPYR